MFFSKKTDRFAAASNPRRHHHPRWFGRRRWAGLPGRRAPHGVDRGKLEIRPGPADGRRHGGQGKLAKVRPRWRWWF